ncbi:MAG: beta-hydroxydecanoyl-ACP dehydratase, partial [Methylovirgula sp.]
MGERRSSYDYEDLIACGRGDLFGPGNPQLPLPPLLMFDKIADISDQDGVYGKGTIRAEFAIKSDHWFFG